MTGTGRTRRTRVLVAFLVLVGGVAAAPSAAGPGDIDPFAQTAPTVDANAVLLTVDLQPDGTAAWRVEYRVRLDDENATAAFEELQAAVEANESAYTARFADRLTATVEDASSATGREMQLRNVTVHASTEQLPQAYGVLTYAFEWTNFAAVDVERDRLRAGDALVGLFLDADSTLLISWPAGYEVDSVSPSPTERRDRSVLWRGPTDFGPGEPELVLASADGHAATDRSLVGLLVVGLVLLGGGGAIAWWRTRSRRTAARVDPTDDANGGPSEELLSNEERVLALLEANGGRMKQQAIVESLGWTDAKTSQVVGALRDAGRLEGFRLGRENVLRLPETDDPGRIESADQADNEG